MCYNELCVLDDVIMSQQVTVVHPVSGTQNKAFVNCLVRSWASVCAAAFTAVLHVGVCINEGNTHAAPRGCFPDELQQTDKRQGESEEHCFTKTEKEKAGMRATQLYHPCNVSFTCFQLRHKSDGP